MTSTTSRGSGVAENNDTQESWFQYSKQPHPLTHPKKTKKRGKISLCFSAFRFVFFFCLTWRNGLEKKETKKVCLRIELVSALNLWRVEIRNVFRRGERSRGPSFN